MTTSPLFGSLVPRAEYARRLETRRRAAELEERWHRRFSVARLGVAFIGLALLVLSVTGSIRPVWLLLPIGSFVALLVAHERVLRRDQRAQRAVRFYDAGLARIEDRWVGLGATGERFNTEAHPYALDLDLFGRGSLFELLSLARTTAGEQTLASWLLAPGDPPVIAARQASVAELGPRLDFRESLAGVGDAIHGAFNSDALRAWAAAPRQLTSVTLLWMSRILPLMFVLLAGFGWKNSYAVGALVLVGAAEAALAVTLRHRVRHVLAGVTEYARELGTFSRLLDLVERETFQSEALRDIRQWLDTSGRRASAEIRRLQRLVEWLNSRNNQLFLPVAGVLLWGTNIAHEIDRWRGTSGSAIGGWIQALGELEALASLAAYAYEHPDDRFPTIVDSEVCFDGQALGHPLIPAAHAVSNDIRLDASTRVLLVSGSNMSGKSTLLRTVGVNAVLALAGAPVRAGRLRLSPVGVGASIRIQDSLQSGRSRFYAEILRIRQIVGMADLSRPVLFLLDELLGGTNSHDRRIGAHAIAVALVERGAIGLLTTHDLALTEIANRLAPLAANVHFEDQFESGEMRFDYRLRPGVVQRSNALALMRHVGLDV